MLFYLAAVGGNTATCALFSILLTLMLTANSEHAYPMNRSAPPDTCTASRSVMPSPIMTTCVSHHQMRGALC